MTIHLGKGEDIYEGLKLGSIQPLSSTNDSSWRIFNVLDYGAIGDGTADDTSAVQSTINAALGVNGAVYFPAGGRFLVSNVNFPNGIRQAFGPGVICDSASSANYDAVVTFGGACCISASSSASVVESLDWSVSIEVSASTTLRAVASAALKNSRIHDTAISWGPTRTDECYGIYLRWITGLDSTNNVIISNNTFLAPVFADYAGRFSAIALIGNSSSYGNYFASGTGDTTDPTMPVTRVVVSDNVIWGGSHGITLNGCQNCTVTGNVIHATKHRGIVLEPVASRNTISGNVIRDYGSSAILMAYGCKYNTVTNNECWTVDDTGESAIEAYVGCERNLIEGNSIHSFTNYGIYLAVDATYNIIIGNRISGYKLAGIALESDWDNPLPAGATYSRPNFGDPPSPYTNWAYAGTVGNIISNNYIGDPRATADNSCAIYLAALKGHDGTSDFTVYYNEITSNIIQPYMVLAYNLFVFEETSGKCENNAFRFNTIYGSVSSKISWTRYRTHFRLSDGNEALNVSTGQVAVGYIPFQTFAAGDTTPSVSFGEYFQASNSGSTLITQFDNSINGQELTLRLDANTGITHNAASIIMQGAHSLTASSRSSSDLMHFKNIDGIWYETWRNWSTAPEPVPWRNFTANDTTPAVDWPGRNFSTANSASTMITNFDNGINGQDICVELDANTGIVHTASLIRLKGAVNIGACTVNANNLIGFVRLSDIWFEQWRNW